MPIPKRIFLFWGNPVMSWFRYMTLYSLVKLNPEWEITLHVSHLTISEKYWKGNNAQDFFAYKGDNYFSKVFDLGINIQEYRYIDPGKHKIGPSHISNVFKWEMLATEGGFYADMDILFVKSLDDLYTEVKDSDVVIAHEYDYPRKRNHFSIGFMASSGDNRFFKEIFETSLGNYNPNAYQCLGVHSIYKLLGTKKYVSKYHINTVEKEYPEYKIHNLDMDVVYPWKFDSLEGYYDELHTKLPPKCVGLHWYAGDLRSQGWNCWLNEKTVKSSRNTVGHWANKVLERSTA